MNLCESFATSCADDLFIECMEANFVIFVRQSPDKRGFIVPLFLLYFLRQEKLKTTK